ncbi:hypothetical protein HK096_006369 [Nowakowskiella sp. JEL0078]|nr:hypothetical protein HK096_006369 [Nowakowskiella sp. JEL0078]
MAVSKVSANLCKLDNCELRWMLESVLAWNHAKLLLKSCRSWSRFSSPEFVAFNMNTHSKTKANASRFMLDFSTKAQIIASDLQKFKNWNCESFKSSGLMDNDRRRLESWADIRLLKDKPLQYILGTQPFGGLQIAVRKPILIPRWETEEWTLKVATKIKQQKDIQSTFRILDLCSGTGCVSLLLASQLRRAFPETLFEVVMCDISLAAIRLSGLNTRRCGFPFSWFKAGNSCKSINDKARINSIGVNVVGILGSVFDEKLSDNILDLGIDDSKFDVVVSNPPYISSAELDDLDVSVKDWEDPRALISGLTGDDAINAVIEVTLKVLKDDSKGDCLEEMIKQIE